jgi:hypothetical protein
VAACCNKLEQTNNLYSIENPHSSFLWRYLEKERFDHSVCEVTFDQCAYGLVLSHKGRQCSIKKPTKLVTNCLLLKSLGLKCPKDHEHVVAFGSVAKAAAAYPEKLCTKWAATVRDNFSAK